MAKTAAVTVPDELKNLEAKALQRRDRFVIGSVQSQRRELSKRRKGEVKGQSVFKILSPIWRTLSPTEKLVWKDAGAVGGLSGWQLFLSDNAARIRFDLSLNVPPSELWQVNAGRIFIQSPADEIVLAQVHPHEFTALRKIVGKPWKKEMVQMTETITFPIDIAIRYKADLTPVGGTQVARYMARLWTSYQGEDVFYDYPLNFEPDTDWELLSLSIPAPRGIVVGYVLYLEISGYTGEVLFDNIRAVHGGTNWALDPRCDEVEKQFTGAFRNVLPFWISVLQPDGATFASFYPPSL